VTSGLVFREYGWNVARIF